MITPGSYHALYFYFEILTMKIFYLALLTFFFSKGFSQYAGPTDEIYLNDSITIYAGLIVEQAPAKYVRIARVKENDTIQVQMKDIWKMLRIYPVQDTLKKKVAIKEFKKDKTKNSFVFLEILGSGGAYSVNYDFRFNKDISNKWGLRVGIEYLSINTVNFSGDLLKYNTVLFPFMVNYLAGKEKNFLELGVGAVYVFKWRNGDLQAKDYEYFIKDINRRIPYTYGTVSIGYRHQTNGKFMWGASITPLIGNSFIIPNVGFKIGYRA